MSTTLVTASTTSEYLSLYLDVQFKRFNSNLFTAISRFVKPTEKVTDYRTSVSGIRPQDIENGDLRLTSK